MKNRTSIFLIFTLALTMAACTKKSPDTPVATVPERLEISPASASVKTGESTGFILKYFNTMGVEAPIPSGVIWSSSDPTIASVNSTGLATGVKPGQTEISAKLNTATAKAILTVVANTNDIATIIIEPGLQELLKNETATLNAVAKNINGDVLSGKTFSWSASNSNFVEINSTTGSVKGLAWGTAEVTASADGKASAPIMVQVIRRGNFSGMTSAGMAKLKIVNGILQLQTTTGFSVQTGPPDLRIYLGPNNGNINGAVEIATLNNRTGMQTWNIPAGTTIGQFRYVIVWCKQFGGTYGVADLGL